MKIKSISTLALAKLHKMLDYPSRGNASKDRARFHLMDRLMQELQLRASIAKENINEDS